MKDTKSWFHIITFALTLAAMLYSQITGHDTSGMQDTLSVILGAVFGHGGASFMADKKLNGK